MEKRTRLELLKLRKRLKRAEKGLGILERKRKALMREFIRAAGRLKGLRKVFTTRRKEAFETLLKALEGHDPYEMKLMSILPRKKVDLEVRELQVMGLKLREFLPSIKPNPDYSENFFRSLTMDEVELQFYRLFVASTKMAEILHKLKSITGELLRTNRRVNSLKYVVIPRLQEKIRRIRDWFDEMEREEKLRLKMLKEAKGGGSSLSL